MKGIENLALFWNRPEAALMGVQFVFFLCLFSEGGDRAARGVFKAQEVTGPDSLVSWTVLT